MKEEADKVSEDFAELFRYDLFVTGLPLGCLL